MRFKNINSNAILNKRLAVFTCALLLMSVAAYCLVPAASANDPGSGDWPMWGGTPDRNMISNMKLLNVRTHGCHDPSDLVTQH